MDYAWSWQHMSYLSLNFVRIRRCVDIFNFKRMFMETKRVPKNHYFW